MNRMIVFLLLLTACLQVSAQPHCFPQCASDGFSCYDGQVQFKRLHGGGKQQQHLYVVRNTSGRTIHLYHPAQHRALSAGTHTYISAHHVSAFVLDKPRFDLVCSVKRRMGWLTEDNFQCVPCQNVLEICRVPTAKLAIGTEGTYWIAENYQREHGLANRLTLAGVSW